MLYLFKLVLYYLLPVNLKRACGNDLELLPKDLEILPKEDAL